MILVWIVIIGAVVLLVRALAGGQWGGGQACGGRSARQVLDERFARGEIDRDEYEEKRQLLQ
jgi:putative membrane protein